MTSIMTLLRQTFVPAPAPAAHTLADEINQFDLAFVIDTTGSMGGLIASAQRQMIAMIEALARAATVDMRLAVVEYRDHPPQDTMIFRAHPFTSNLNEARKTINDLKAQGGGDMPEAVLDGVLAACCELAWRPHARRIAVLIGDAPPHAHCACGETIESVTAAVERTRVTLYALGLTGHVTEPFGKLSRLTGGEFFSTGQGDEAIARLQAILSDEFGNLDFDRRVLAAKQADPELTVADLTAQLAATRGTVSAALSRLSKRQLA